MCVAKNVVVSDLTSEVKVKVCINYERSSEAASLNILSARLVFHPFVCLIPLRKLKNETQFLFQICPVRQQISRKHILVVSEEYQLKTFKDIKQRTQHDFSAHRLAIS